MQGLRDRPAAIVFLCCAVLGVFQAWLLLPYLGVNADKIGEDYALFLPNLLAGHFWFLRNGLSSLPWFTPAFCGGFPFYADANAPWFSLPQFLTFAVGPLNGVRITVFVFAELGFIGTYLLMRRSFGLSVASAAIAGALFMFNGFHAARMLVGHVSFHTFMLVPGIAALILPAARARPGLATSVVRISLAGLGFAAMLEAGMVHGIPPALLAIVIIILLQAWRDGMRLRPFVYLLGAGVLALALSAAKLVAMLALLAQLPRNMYPLPGFADLGTLLEVAYRVVFLTPPEWANDLLSNRQWRLDQHEWEYGISPLALLLILAGALCAMRVAWLRYPPRVAPRGRAAMVGVVLVLLCLPLMVNFYTPGWNAVLKSLPFFGNSSNLVRWFSLYTMVAVVAAGLGCEAIFHCFRFDPGKQMNAMAAAILALLSWQLLIDRGHYAEHAIYPPWEIEAADARARDGAVPDITVLAVYTDAAGNVVTPVERNGTLTAGQSQLACYQPMFGYKLEAFPVGKLQLGPMLADVDGALNVKNPACYLFPAENACRPGDHFPLSARAAAERFLSYRPFAFVLPGYAEAAVWVSGLALGVVALALIGGGLGSWRARGRG